MTPQQQSVLSRYGISDPPKWTGMTGTGADAMYSIGGKWLKAGQKHPSGYTVGQYDPKSKALGMSIYGVNIPIGMQSSTVQNFEAPYNPYEDPSINLTEIMDKTKSQRDQFAKSKATLSDFEQQQAKAEPDFENTPLEKIAEHEKYNIGEDSFNQLYKNLVNSGSLSDSDLPRVMTLKEYDKRMKNKELKPDTKYYIPTSDGQLDVFMTREQDYQ
jgi:hypothetical protein